MKAFSLAFAWGLLACFNVAKAQTAHIATSSLQDQSIGQIGPDGSARLLLSGPQAQSLFGNHFDDPWDIEQIALFQQGMNWFLAARGLRNGRDFTVVCPLQRYWNGLFVPPAPQFEFCNKDEGHFCCYCSLPFTSPKTFCCAHR